MFFQYLWFHCRGINRCRAATTALCVTAPAVYGADMARRPPTAASRPARPRGAGGTAAPSRLWAIVNSPIVLLVVSGVVIGGGAKLYADGQSAAAEVAGRRAEYVELLAELQRRVSRLKDADGRLDRFIGAADSPEALRKVPEPWPQRAAFERESALVGAAEADILAGRGSYVPTAPAYAGIDLLTLAARLERVGGVPDLQLGALRLLRTLDADPEVLWLFVRAHRPMLERFVVSRHLLHVEGDLPLPAGAALTPRQEAVLDIPRSKPGDLQRLRRENDVLHARLDRELREAAKR